MPAATQVRLRGGRQVWPESTQVSPGIQTKPGVKVGSRFKGSVYHPGAAQTAIDADKCCTDS
ncbi:MAG TPA: hypothetical protein VD835_04650 [Pyrinomonadaceae bacterium]|nr:hypothetical protein [Pyrinomonadaceae bacterium]